MACPLQATVAAIAKGRFSFSTGLSAPVEPKGSQGARSSFRPANSTKATPCAVHYNTDLECQSALIGALATWRGDTHNDSASTPTKAVPAIDAAMVNSKSASLAHRTSHRYQSKKQPINGQSGLSKPIYRPCSGGVLTQ